MTDRWRLGRRPGLDVLRGVAILLVLAAHAGVPGLDLGGGVGVTLFFVLSGFLITSLLVEEHHRSGRIELAAFYRRRARRLLPALWTMVAVLLLVGGLAWHHALAALTYTGNWSFHGFTAGGLVAQTWTLAIEEQFYLVWPLVVILVLRRRPDLLVPVALAGALASTLERLVLLHLGASTRWLDFGTDVRADGLLAGAALGAALAGGWRPPKLSRPTVAAAGAVLAGMATFFVGTAHDYFAWGVTATVLSSAVLVLYAATTSAGASPRWAWLRGTGRISYGLYLWHYPLVRAGLGDGLPAVPRIALLVACSYALALASWYLVERPVSRRSGRRGLGVGRRHVGVEPLVDVVLVPVEHHRSPQAGERRAKTG